MNNKRAMALLASVVTSGIAAASAAPMLEEVVVTAQKREESLQETPISIVAFSQKTIETQRITDMMDLDGKVPNMTLPAFAIEMNSATPFIRGIGNTEMQISYDLAVGVYRDGVYLGRSTGFGADTSDTERVEVLRGPQGTLYGRNTTGGAINIITKKPNDEYYFDTYAGVGNHNMKEVGGTFNIPITDTFFTRGAIKYSDDDGWYDNVGVGPNYNERKKTAGNISLRYLFNDALTFDYMFDTSEIKGGQAAVQIDRSRAPVYDDFVRTNRMDTLSEFGGEDSKLDIYGHALTVSFETDYGTLKSISSYRKMKEPSYFDYSQPFYYLYNDVSAEAHAAVTPVWPIDDAPQELDVKTKVHHEQYSQELQFVGVAMEDRLNYVAGLYYFHEEGTQDIFLRSNGLAGAILGGFLPDGLAVTSTVGDTTAKSSAVYLQASYTPPILEDKLTATVGARYTRDKRDAELTKIGYSTSDYAFDYPSLVPVTYFKQPGNVENNKTTPTVTLEYAITDASNTYIKYSEGYRSGGFNLRSTAEAFIDGYGPEELTAWEVGYKSTWFENRLRVNIAVFDYDYKDIIVDQSVPDNITSSFTINAGSASIKGMELDLTAVLTPDLSLDLSYGYTDASYDTFIQDGADVADQRRLPFTPKQSANASLDYDIWSFSNGQLNLWLNYAYRTKQWGNPGGESKIDPMGIYNATLSLDQIKVGEGNVSLSLWGRNLMDDEYTNNAVDFGSYTYVIYGEPRSYGIEARYTF
jgi:iron complex outermembrane receptor protein